MRIKREEADISNKYLIEVGDLIFFPEDDKYSLVIPSLNDTGEITLFDLHDHTLLPSNYHPIHLKNWLNKHHQNYELIKSSQVELVIQDSQ
jgi:hypothetical protein